MNKKLLMAAVASALVAGPMLAQADVKLSGSAHLSIDQLKGNSTTAGTDNGSEMNVSSNSSYVQFDAGEDLGSGLKGFFSMREYFRLDNANASTTAGGRMYDGNAIAGLTGDFGTFALGSHDSPVKLIGRGVDLFGDQIGDSRNLNVDNTRASNVIAYFTPNFSGFNAKLVMVTNTNTSNTLESSTTGTVISVGYSAPMFSVDLGRQELDVASSKSDPTTTVLTGSVNLDAFKIVALWQTYEADEDTSAKADITTKGIGVSYSMGNNTLKLQRYDVSDESNASIGGSKVTNKDASMLALGVDHVMSKNTKVYAAYAKTDNDSSAAYSMAGGGHGDNPGTVTGKDPSGLSFGMVMKF